MSFLNNPIVNNFTIDTSNYKVLIENFTATQDQKVFTLTNTYEIGRNRLEVFVDNVQQYSPTNFTETSTTSITLAEGLLSGSKVVVKVTQIN